MRLSKKTILLLCVAVFSGILMSADDGAEQRRDIILGSIIKNSLEQLHYSKKKVDDDLSIRAFEQYLDRMDFSKRFFLESDVKQLRSMERKIDEMVFSGDLTLIEKSEKILNKRIVAIESFVKEILKAPLDFSKKETIETDPEKRDWPKTEKELFERWNKIIKLDVLSRYFSIIDEQEEAKEKKEKDAKTSKTDAKKEKKKEEKKFTTFKEIEAEARKRTLKSYDRVFKRLKKIDHSDELTRFFNSVTSVFDPHTTYLAPRDKEDFDISMTGSLEGIGAILREDGDYIKVVEIIPGSAAWRGKKLKAEDIILRVGQSEKDPVDIVGMRVEEAVQLIRGPKGSEVRLTVKKPEGEVMVIPIVRDIVVIEETYVKYATVQIQGVKEKFGYIHVPQFYRDFSKDFDDKTARNCTTDVENAIKELQKQGVQSIVLDLRNNGGGSLEDARMMSGLFIKEGPIVQIKSSANRVQILRDGDGKISFDGPLVVMVNKFSASASEILAGALKDYGRAVIVGSGKSTHGKGTVQTILDLDRYVNTSLGLIRPLGSVKLTVQKFYRINGSSTQYKGITPHISLPDPLEHIKTGERELEYSLPWDEVAPLKYSKWPVKIPFEKLSKSSESRVKKSDKFKKILETVEYLKEKQKVTKISLNFEEYKKERDENKSHSKDLDFDIKDSHLKLLNTSFENFKTKLSEDQKRRADEWKETLQKDPTLEEAMYILKDLTKA